MEHLDNLLLLYYKLPINHSYTVEKICMESACISTCTCVYMHACMYVHVCVCVCVCVCVVCVHACTYECIIMCHVLPQLSNLNTGVTSDH